MVETMIFLISIFVGFAFGWKAREVYAKHVVQSFMMNDIKKSILNVNVVKTNGSFLIYNAENDAFIVQVKNRDELYQFFHDKHQDVTVMMKKEHFELFDVIV